MATILLCGVELFMRGKLDAVLPGHRLITVDHTEDPELVLDVVLLRVLLRETVHDLGPLVVGVVDLDERVPLVRQRVLGEDRLDRALRFARAAIDALLRVDDEDPVGLVDAVDRADVDAGAVFDVDTGLGDDVRHCALL